MPKDVPFEDITAVPPFFGQHKIDTLRQAKELGFARVIAFAYAMNPEVPTFAFPQPRLRQMIDMARYVRDAGLDGIDGYRLAPTAACSTTSPSCGWRGIRTLPASN